MDDEMGTTATASSRKGKRWAAVSLYRGNIPANRVFSNDERDMEGLAAGGTAERRGKRPTATPNCRGRDNHVTISTTSKHPTFMCSLSIASARTWP